MAVCFTIRYTSVSEKKTSVPVKGTLELMIGLEPTTYALPRRCATDCATSAINI